VAIVGTAYVRLRVIGDKLKNDIAKATSDAVDKSAPQLSNSGKEVGEKISDGVGESLEKSVGSKMGKVADDIGEQIGRRMAENMGKSLRRRAGDAFSSGFANVRSRVSSIGDSVKGEWEKVSTKWASLTGKNFGQKLKGFLVGGIAFAITALPSLLAFAGAVAGALVATLVPAIGLVGTAAAGAGLAAVAAFSTIKITAGLVGLAMKTPSAALDDFHKRAEDFKATIGTPIQAGLLSGFNAALRIAQPIIGSLQPMLRELGTNVGDVAIGFADAFRQGAMMERLQRILTVNNDAIKLAGPGVTGLAQAFAVLLDHLSPIILYLASGVGQLGQWANTAILAAEGTGALDNFITSMFTNMTRFVGVLVDFGVGIFNVFLAAGQQSQSMLGSLEGIAARFREWTGDPANQDRMVTFFANMRTIASEVVSIFGELAGAGGRALEGTDTDSVITGLRGLVDAGKAVGSMFEQIRAAAGPALGEAFASFVNLITNLANSGVLGTLASAFANLFNIISFLLNIPGVAQLLTFVAGLAALFTTVKFLLAVLKPLQIVFTVFRIVLVALAGVIGWIPIVIGLLVAALIWFFTQTEIGRDIIAAVWDFIKNAIKAAVDWIVGAWDWMVKAFQTAVAWVVDLAQSIWSAISTAFNAVVDTVVSVFTTVRDFIIGVWNAIWGFVQPILQGIWDFISTVFNAIRTVIETILGVIYEIWIRVWPLLALPIRILYGVIILIFTAVWDFIKWIFQAIWDFVVMVWNGIVTGVTWYLNLLWAGVQFIIGLIWGFISTVFQAVWDFIVMVWDGIVAGVTWALDRLWTGIKNIWDAIWGFIQPILQRIGSFISGVWSGIVDGVMGFLNNLWTGVQNIWNGIIGFISGAMDTIGGLISGVWDFLSGVGEDVLDGIKSAINVVIDAINLVISGINWAIDMANKLPGADIPNIPEIPRLAKGGIVSPNGGGTLAMIAEAGRRERVEPLDPSGLSQRDRALIQQLSGGSGGVPNVTVYLGTREIEDVIDVVVEDRENGLADRVLTGTKV
jgi:phage-related protein